MNTFEVDGTCNGPPALSPKLVPGVPIPPAWLGQGDLMQPHREIPVEIRPLWPVAMHGSGMAQHVAGPPLAHSELSLEMTSGSPAPYRA